MQDNNTNNNNTDKETKVVNTNPNMKWYLIQCVSNKELQVQEALQNRRVSEKMEKEIGEIYVPLKTIFVNSSNGKGKEKKKPVYPGYVYVQMEINDEVWFIIRNTKDVTGLVGSSGNKTKPMPIQDSQIIRMKDKEKEIEESYWESKNHGVKIDFKDGDVVEITDGVAIGERGIIKKINHPDQTSIVEIEMFGRRNEITVAIKSLKKAY